MQNRFIDTIFNFTSITSGFTNLFNDSTLLTYAGVAILAIVLFGNQTLCLISFGQPESCAGTPRLRLGDFVKKLRYIVFQG